MKKPPKFFEQWFELLARQKFGAALLPVSGISIGYFLTLSSRIMPPEFYWYVGFIGLLLVYICSAMFIMVVATYLLRWRGSAD